MTSSGIYNNGHNRHAPEYVSNRSTNHSPPRRPNRANNSSAKLFQEGTTRTGGENESRLLNLSERIKKLSTSKVLKDSSVLSHNNNEPFTYLKGGRSIGATTSHIPAKPARSHLPNERTYSANNNRREVIYAQVVVDPEERNHHNFSNGKTKRTIHRSYNNKSYTSPFAQHPSSQSQMKGRNVTTVLLNSSSDDVPSSLNYEEKVGFNEPSTAPYRGTSTSPLLLQDNEDSFYPKSLGIVKQLQNGHGGGSRFKYENTYQKKSNYHYQGQNNSEDEEELGGFGYVQKYNREKSPAPFQYSYNGGKGDTDYSDDYPYQPMIYSGGKSLSTNFIDDYGSKRSRDNYRIDEEDEEYGYDVGRGDERRSKTLQRNTSFKNRTEDFINRSKTLDNRISSLRERSMMLEERERREKGGLGMDRDPYNFKLTTSLSNKESKSNTTLNKTKSKEKLIGSGSNIFSTLLRRNNNKDGKAQSKSTPVLNTKSEKKPHSNFFTAFLEKRKKNQEAVKGQPLKSNKSSQLRDENTYQSFNNWPSSEPPSFSVIDYSAPLPRSHYGGEPFDTEDNSSTVHGGSSDIWKKSYGNDMTKVKRRWTLREPNQTQTTPGVIRKEETLRTLERKPKYSSSTAINPEPIHGSIDRRKQQRTYSTDQERYTMDETDNSNTYLKVPGSRYNTFERYSPEKNGSYRSKKFGEYDGSFDRSNTNTLTRRGNLEGPAKEYVGGVGHIGTPMSSGSESKASRSVYLHEPAVIPEMPRTATSTGGGASLSGLSGRRTLSKDEISNYSGPRRETKQLSRSMSMAHPWSPNKTYREKYSEIDYSRNNNLQLPPRPPSRSPSGSLGIQAKHTGTGRSPSKSSTTTPQRPRPPIPPNKGGRTTKPIMSSSVESLLRQDTPDEIYGKKKGNNTKLGRSKSMSVSQPGQGRFSTLWFNKRNLNK